MKNFQQCSIPQNKSFIFNIIIIFGLSSLSFLYGCAQKNTRCLACHLGVHCLVCDCNDCIIISRIQQEYRLQNGKDNDFTLYICDICSMPTTSKGKCFECLDLDQEINSGEGGAGGYSGDKER
jgi:hypothetical protein